jgi:hypothetical protein
VRSCESSTSKVGLAAAPLIAQVWMIGHCGTATRSEPTHEPTGLTMRADLLW